MSTYSFPKIDQKEYLKKYISGDKVKKKKKDKHRKSSAAFVKVKIIDDDINHLDNGAGIDEELLLAGEDAPQIVGEYIDESQDDRKIPKWKSIVIKDEPEDRHADLWGRKSDEVRVKQEFPIDKKFSNRTPDNSPPRRKERRRKSSSPPRRHRKSASPSRKSKRDKSPSWSKKNEISPDRRTKFKIEPLSPLNKKRDQTIPQSYSKRKDSFYISCARERSFDQSPPRRAKSPQKSSRKRSPDLSPPKRRRSSDQYPPRKGKSPIRKGNNRSTYHYPACHRKDYDQSPPRRVKSPDQSLPRRRRNSDQSPQRRDSPDQSPPRRKRNFDQSPIRRRTDLDNSPPRRVRRSDQSPPRHRRNSDLLPPSKGKNRHSSDISPPRKNRSPPLRKRKDNSPDQSPRRKNSDQSPPRRNRISPSKYQKRSPNQSPTRRRKSPKRNLSPARIKREKQTQDLSPRPRCSRWEKQKSDKSLSPPPTHKPKPGKTLEGKKAGLQDAKALQKETTERRKQEDLLFEKMSSDVSGRNAEVQVRSTGRKGRRAREASQEDPKERRRKEEHEEKKKLLYDRWGKGLKQIEDHKNRMLEQEYESSKPLARYSNDEDLEKHLKEQERAEDPMLEYMRQKRKEKEKLSCKPQIPRYEGSYPENRFGIRPGYRWDGVDRSNGYEKKYFAVQNEKQARQDEAYKYSVEDM